MSTPPPLHHPPPSSSPPSGSGHPVIGQWRSEADVDARRKMIAKIVALLQQRKPNAPPEWLKKLPQMAKRLEESLYRNAGDFESYNDVKTLKSRLQTLAMSIGQKTQAAKNAAANGAGGVAPSAAPPQPAVASGMVNMNVVNAITAPGQPASSSNGRIAVNGGLPVVEMPGEAGRMSSMAGGGMGGGLQQQQQQQAVVQQNRQQVLRHQQQRLLLLRHAAKCPHDNGKCPVTPHCAGMKRLWLHIAECKDQKCMVPHCVSSRYVLSHYHRCKDPRCPVCMPVREAIHRSHEKAKQMQLLKQRQEGSGGTGYVMGDGKKRRTGEKGGKGRGRGGKGKVQVQPQQQMQMQMQQQQRFMQQQGRGGYQGGQGGAPRYQQQQVIMQVNRTGPRPQEDHTLVNTFTIEEIEAHIDSLTTGISMPPAKLKQRCLDLVNLMISNPHGWVFNAPVDPVELGLTDYFELIKKPMDLGTIKKKVESGGSHDIEQFRDEVVLCFDNAMTYNAEASPVWNMAVEIKQEFKKIYDKVIKELRKEQKEKCTNENACLLCGCEKLNFEPPVFYCNGLNCSAKRIRRNSYYYVAVGNQYHWCQQCYQELKENNPLEMGDMTVVKSELGKKKNDEVHEESWVACDTCGRWIHQICGLFNTRQNKDQRSEYDCPRCTINKRKAAATAEANQQSSTPGAEDLPRTRLSEYLERHIREMSVVKFKEFAQEKAAAEKTSFEEAFASFTDANKMGAIHIRQVTAMDKKIDVREGMKTRYKFKEYPDDFSYRCKCLVVFQRIEAVDVMLFGLYVYEHDEKNPAPNARAVYVSYLDSVYYMRPRKIRTFIYHELLIAYLDYVRQKGFATAHIWACPPLKGDDYILYAKPEDQKTPKDQQLRQWYVDMLDTCLARGVVKSVTNMYDLYFKDPKNNATVIPYLEGDYWVGEAENVIKELDEGKGKKGKAKKAPADKKQKNKGANSRGGTRSTGLDEEALLASGMIEPPPKSLEEGGRDMLMKKLGEAIEPMKESFLVAFLDWEEPTAKRTAELEKEADEAKKAEEDEKAVMEKKKILDADKAKKEDEENKDGLGEGMSDVKVEPGAAEAPVDGDAKMADADAPPEAAKSTSSGMDAEEQAEADMLAAGVGEDVDDASQAGGDDAVMSAAPSPEAETKRAATPTRSRSPTSQAKRATPERESTRSSRKRGREEVAPDIPEPKVEEVAVKEEPKEEVAAKEEKKEEVAVTEEKEEEAAAKEEGDEKEKEAEIFDPVADEAKRVAEDVKKLAAGFTKIALIPATVRNKDGTSVKVIDDDNEDMDCEFLNSRQAFLNLCQGNHYQNDTLRRAKHTSMMVLWHLHNRDAPKFVQQCACCSREILSGFRYHCPVCNDFDVCQDCITGPMRERPHPHQLKPIAVSQQQSELTEAQRKERQRSIQLHMQLLGHAAGCTNSACPSANCSKMKGLLTHGSACQVKATGGCHICKRIWALLQLHARQCKDSQCKVPSCGAIRERARQIFLQQQAMDDRRRQQMNKAMRGGGGGAAGAGR